MERIYKCMQGCTRCLCYMFFALPPFSFGRVSKIYKENEVRRNEFNYKKGTRFNCLCIYLLAGMVSKERLAYVGENHLFTFFIFSSVLPKENKSITAH